MEVGSLRHQLIGRPESVVFVGALVVPGVSLVQGWLVSVSASASLAPPLLSKSSVQLPDIHADSVSFQLCSAVLRLAYPGILAPYDTMPLDRASFV